jgi:hypothetical protein
MEKATIMGIDLAKRVFQVHAASKDAGRYCANGAARHPPAADPRRHGSRTMGRAQGKGEEYRESALAPA